MGIRINTVLGYGFRYSTFARDPRFAPWVWDDKVPHPTLPPDLDPREEDLRPLLAAHYKLALAALPKKPRKKGVDDPHWYKRHDLEWDLNTIEGGGSGIVGGDKGDKPWTLHDFLIYNPFNTEDHHGCGPVVFTMPKGTHEWFRHDDTIDYYLAPRGAHGMEDSITPILGEQNLPVCIYPYDRYVDRRTGEPPKTGKFTLGVLDRAFMIETWAKSDKFPKARSKPFPKSSDLKDMTAISFQRDIVPYVPNLIRELCGMLGVFRNPLTIHRLKPMVYRYWC